ncbi:MAG: GNAT family N-acetyltransferase [Candidatus Thorarchaeota archaeon]
MEIKKATSNDKEQLIKSFRHYNIKKHIEDRVECYLSHNNTIIALENNQLIGRVQWQIKEDPNLGAVEFEAIYVVKEFRRKGVGSSLLKFAIQSVKDYFKDIGIKSRRIFLFVNQNNINARHLYEKFGFKCITNLGKLFSDTENELLYALDLT